MLLFPSVSNLASRVFASSSLSCDHTQFLRHGCATQPRAHSMPTHHRTERLEAELLVHAICVLDHQHLHRVFVRMVPTFAQHQGELLGVNRATVVGIVLLKKFRCCQTFAAPHLTCQSSTRTRVKDRRDPQPMRRTANALEIFWRCEDASL
jgi:hypothetical protein